MSQHGLQGLPRHFLRSLMPYLCTPINFGMNIQCQSHIHLQVNCLHLERFCAQAGRCQLCSIHAAAGLADRRQALLCTAAQLHLLPICKVGCNPQHAATLLAHTRRIHIALGAMQQFGARTQHWLSSRKRCMPFRFVHSRSWMDHLDTARGALPAASAVLERHRPVVALKLLEAAQAAGRRNPRHHATVACSRARCSTRLYRTCLTANMAHTCKARAQ